MATQEEWRRQAYEEWVGRTGNNSMGTQANQRGYEEYKRLQGSSWASGGSSMPEPVIYTPGPTSGGGGSRSAGGPGILDSFCDCLAEMSNWFVVHIWPLKISAKLGEWIAGTDWKVRLPVALLGAFLSAGLLTNPGELPASWLWAQAALVEIAGEYAVLLALGLGALAGWLSFDVAGYLLIFAVYLIGLALGLAVTAFVLGLAYTVIAAIAGWPPLWT